MCVPLDTLFTDTSDCINYCYIRDALVNGYTDWWESYAFADFMDDCYRNEGL